MSSRLPDAPRSEWDRLEEALQRAIDCPPETVGEVLDEVSTEDESLGRELKTLLEASRRLSFLDSPALAAAGVQRQTRELAGFEIEHEIGRGGMGVVYYATRETGRPREAAIKFLTTPGERQSWDARFRREREILSRLDHSNIARLLDGGQDPVPFLVMEYVDGSRLDRYCERQHASIEQRLRWFLEICDAVHYAHQNLVIHCDLKPANILVDAAGIPKLLDFGIARILDRGGGPSIDVTRTSVRPLTLDYASPEQIEGRPPTTAGDVYSLGVVLYEILCGDRPHHLRARAPHEISTLLEKDDPALPSEVAATAAGDGKRVSVRCGLSAAALARRLQGDLDLIVKKALRFDPRHRYASAAEFAGDVKRHLEGLPIQARPESLRYAALKLIRRHKLASTISGLMITAVVAFGGAMAWQNARIVRAQKQAESAFGASKAVSEFLVGLFEEAEEIGMGDRQMTAGELVDRGAERLGDSLRKQPATRAAVEHALGRLYTTLNRYPDARQHLESALATRRALGESSLVADSLEQLGQLHRQENRYDAARQALNEALALRRAETDAPGGLASTLFELASLERNVTAFDNAERLFQESIALRREVFGERSLETAKGLHGLSEVFRDTSRYDEAEDLLEQVIEIRSERLAPDHLTVGAAANSLSRVFRSQGRFDQAEVVSKRVISIYEAAHGPEHLSVASAKMNLAIVYGSTGKYDRARELLEQALAIFRATFDGPHHKIAASLFNLATVVDLQGDHQRAIELYQEAANAYEVVHGPGHETIGAVLYNLGTLYVVTGEVDLAETYVGRGFEIYRQWLPPGHDRFADATAALADIAHLRGDLKSAQALAQEAITIFKKASATHPNLAYALRRMALIELDQGNLTAARSWLERALENFRSALPPFHEDRLGGEIDWADWLVASSREAEAEQLLFDLLASVSEFEPEHRSKPVFIARVAAANLRLGRLLQQGGHPKEGLARLATAEAQLRSIASRSAEAERDLALTLAALGQAAEASRVASGLFRRGVRDRRLEPLVARSAMHADL